MWLSILGISLGIILGVTKFSHHVLKIAPSGDSTSGYVWELDSTVLENNASKTIRLNALNLNFSFQRDNNNLRQEIKIFRQSNKYPFTTDFVYLKINPITYENNTYNYVVLIDLDFTYISVSPNIDSAVLNIFANENASSHNWNIRITNF